MEHEPFLSEQQAADQLDADNQEGSSALGEDIDLSLFFYCIFALKFLVELNTSLLELPTRRLIEQMICNSTYGREARYDETDCKAATVQDKTALIIGLKITFDAFSCLLTALYYGALSNSRGRRFVMILSNCGQFMGLLWIMLIGLFTRKAPAELAWFASVLSLIGGGVRIEMAMQYASFCDAIPERKRTELLSYLHAAAGVAGLAGYPISAFFLRINLWSAFMVVVLIFMVKLAVLLRIPETTPKPIGSTADSLIPQELDNATMSSIIESHSRTESWSPMVGLRSVVIHLRSLKDSMSGWQLRQFLTNADLKLVFICFVIKRIGFASLSFVAQQASEITQKRLLETFWLGTLQRSAALVALVFVLPVLMHRVTMPAKNIWIIRGSAFSLMIGSSILWRSRSMGVFCTGMMICGLGEGLETGMQSLGSYVSGASGHAAFFSLAGMLGVVGEMSGGPLMASVYGIRDTMGLPLGYSFLLSTGCFGIIFACSYFISGRRRAA